MADFRAEIDSLREEAKQLQTQINKYKELEKKINTLLVRMRSSWEGDACNSYMNMMALYQGRINKMIQVLTDYKSYVEKSVTIIEDKDREIASQINNSFDGGKYSVGGGRHG